MAYILNGIAARLAFSNGLNIESLHSSLPVDTQEAKRTWWLIYIQEVELCLDSGRPMCFGSSDMNIHYPTMHVSRAYTSEVVSLLILTSYYRMAKSIPYRSKTCSSPYWSELPKSWIGLSISYDYPSAPARSHYHWYNIVRRAFRARQSEIGAAEKAPQRAGPLAVLTTAAPMLHRFWPRNQRQWCLDIFIHLGIKTTK